jgi:hypothetical protein
VLCAFAAAQELGVFRFVRLMAQCALTFRHRPVRESLERHVVA